MEIGELLNQNLSKKLGVTITTIAVLAYLNAHPGYIIAVAIIEILVQGYLDRPKNQNSLQETEK